MWTELLRTDLNGIKEFAKVQRTCSDIYAVEMNDAKVTAKFQKETQFGLRGFVYRDANYEINLATAYDVVMKKSVLDTMVLRTVGIGKYKTIAGAVKIVMQKIAGLSIEYHVDKIIAGWGDDVYPYVQEFYQGMAKAFVDFGFKFVELTQPDEHSYEIKVGRDAQVIPAVVDV